MWKSGDTNQWVKQNKIIFDVKRDRGEGGHPGVVRFEPGVYVCVCLSLVLVSIFTDSSYSLPIDWPVVL